MNKLAFIGKLYYELSRQDSEFRLAYAWIKDNGDICWTKHKTFQECCNDDWFLSKCNNRSILPCEIVLDVDCETNGEAKIKREFISSRLKDLNVPFKCYFTGSKGYHFHLYKYDWFYLPSKEREQRKKDVIEFFQCDGMKAYNKTMIAMEDCPHWKTGNMKELIEEWMQ